MKVYGKRQIPFTFNQNKIFLKFIICDVVQPLISTNDLLNAGASIIIDKNNPMIRFNKTDFPLTPLNKHFCLKLDNVNKNENWQMSKCHFDGSMCNNVSTIMESVETTIDVSESEQSCTSDGFESSNWEDFSDSSSDDFNFQGEYEAFQIRAELEDDSVWEIREVKRTRESENIYIYVQIIT